MKISFSLPLPPHTVYAPDAFKNIVGRTTIMNLGPEEVSAKIISAKVFNGGRDVEIELEF